MTSLVGLDVAYLWMYAPITETLCAGLASLGKVSVQAIVRPATPLGNLSGAFWRRLHRLRRGDRFIFVGQHAGKLPWTSLRQRGVRTAFYETEPKALSCRYRHRVRDADAPEELWSYSHRVLELCARAFATRRYLPPGYIEPPTAEGVAISSSTRPAAELFFLGYPFYRGRAPCYQQLRTALGERLNATWALYTPEDFRSWWTSHGARAVHLSLHKHHRLNARCADPSQPFEAVRAALLLSRGARLISLQSDPRDEAEYAGLVHFATLDEVPRLLVRLLARVRATHPQGKGTAVASRFRRRFDPRRLMEIAGVYANWTTYRTRRHVSLVTRNYFR